LTNNPDFHRIKIELKVATMTLKMILCDLDGTLYNSDKNVDEYTADIIRKVRQKGVIFGIASGRKASYIHECFEKQGLDDLIDVIVGDGGFSIDDRLIDIEQEACYLSLEAAHRIMDGFKGYPVVYGVPIGSELVFSKESPIVHHVTSINKYPSSVMDFNLLKPDQLVKLCVFCMEDDLNLIEEHAKKIPMDDLNAHYVRSGPYLIEYADNRVTKEQGIARLLDAHGYSKDELMVFGDADNDYGMIRYATYGIVMANGSEKTKSVAYDVTLDNNHSGVGVYIKQHVLDKL